MDDIEASLRATPQASQGVAETLVDVFRETAARCPAIDAVAMAGASLTYAQLDRRSDALAARLSELSAGRSLRDVVVGLCTGRGPDLVTGILGIAKAGAAWLPLEPTLPARRLRYMLSDSSAPMAVCDAEGLAVLGTVEGVAMLSLAADGQAPDAMPEAPEPGDAAYVIYTSGSAGQPKGVVVEHASAARLARAHAALFGLRRGSRAALYASIAFDAAISDMFSAFAAGATLHVADETERRLPAALTALLERERIEVITLPPVVLGRMERRPLPDLRTIVVAGETGRAEDLDWWARDRRVVNAYGPTEAAVCACAAEYRPGDPPARIGRALPHALLQVLDAARRRVPVGVDGELYIGGGGVARGYLGRPELTAARFVELPELGGRFFRTGDRVRWLEPGVLEFRGRLDEQVKINGNRVEPDEVARAIETLEGVGEAAVLALGEDGARQLVAFVAGAPHAPPTDRIAAHLAGLLPDYMLPARYVPVPGLPLNNSGKLDRAALARLAETPVAVADDPPRTPTEIAVAELWCEALGLPAVRRGDNFYALGGDSLRLTGMLLRINRTMGTTLVASRFRRLPTLADLAAYADLTAAPADLATTSQEL